jgi:hypothetical protein
MRLIVDVQKLQELAPPAEAQNLHVTVLLYKKCGQVSRFLGISREFPLISPQKWTPQLPL